jgi:hypothetical protein
MYVVIGWIAVQIAFGHSRQQADRTGALHVLGGNWFGEIALWLLVVGFAGLALWRLTEAIYGTPGDNDKATTPITLFGKAVTYTVITYGVLKYALGIGAPKSSDTQSVDLTATAMSHPGGRAVVIIAGLALIGAGIALAYSAARKHFLKKLATGQMRPRTRQAVTWLGRAGGIARGAVFVTAGVFLLVAAIEAQPQQAKGLDLALRPRRDAARPVAPGGGGHRPHHVWCLFVLRGPLAPAVAAVVPVTAVAPAMAVVPVTAVVPLTAAVPLTAVVPLTPRGEG